MFVYYLEDHPAFSFVASQILHTVETGYTQATTSIISVAEVMVGPQRYGDQELARVYEIRMHRFPNLTVRGVDRAIARTAARIRGSYGFRLPDAFQLATAIETSADTFLTNDRRLQQFEELPVTLLSDLVH